jgi:hypothetical protein
LAAWRWRAARFVLRFPTPSTPGPERRWAFFSLDLFCPSSTPTLKFGAASPCPILLSLSGNRIARALEYLLPLVQRFAIPPARSRRSRAFPRWPGTLDRGSYADGLLSKPSLTGPFPGFSECPGLRLFECAKDPSRPKVRNTYPGLLVTQGAPVFFGFVNHYLAAKLRAGSDQSSGAPNALRSTSAGRREGDEGS